MIEWFQGFFPDKNKGIPQEFLGELKNHSPRWQERLRAYIEKPPVTLTDLAGHLDVLNTAVAEQCARDFLQGREEGWMHEQSIVVIRDNFHDWARLQQFQNEEIHLMWKFLCQEYYQEEVRAFVQWIRGAFEDEVFLKKMNGKLRDHPGYVQGGFGEWGKNGAGRQYNLTEQEEYYCWQGVEWQLFSARDVGKRLGSEAA